MQRNISRLTIFGIAAGLINGLIGAGGGMVLVPLLTRFTKTPEDEIFPTSVSIILPICVVSLIFSLCNTRLSWKMILPYLIGSITGGIAAGIWGNRIPKKWLHRFLGVLMIWGGYRYLC